MVAADYFGMTPSRDRNGRIPQVGGLRQSQSPTFNTITLCSSTSRNRIKMATVSAPPQLSERGIRDSSDDATNAPPPSTPLPRHAMS